MIATIDLRARENGIFSHSTADEIVENNSAEAFAQLRVRLACAHQCQAILKKITENSDEIRYVTYCIGGESGIRTHGT